jgi:purine-binding chemotaxis protein CheW
MHSAIDAGFIRGLAQVGERMVILLDIEGLLMSPDMGLAD